MIFESIKKMLHLYFDKCAIIFLLFLMSIFLFTSSEQMSGTYIDRYSWDGLICLAVAILIVFRVDLKNYWIYIAISVFLLGYGYYALKTGYRGYAPDLWNVITRKGVVYILTLALLTDAIKRNEFFRVNELDIPKVILFLGALAGAVILPNGYRNVEIVIVFAVFLLISFANEKSELMIVCLAIGNILATSAVSMKSLIRHPYAGEQRYYGPFTYLHGFAMFIGSGLVCCIFLYVYGFLKRWNKAMLIIALTPFLLLNLVTFYFINSRTAQLGIAVVLLVLAWALSLITGKKKVFNRSIIALAAILVCGIGIVLFFGINYFKYNESILEKVPKLQYLAGMVQYAMGKDSRTGLFADQSWVAYVDGFTSGRLSIWKVIINQLKLFSGNNMSIVVTDEWVTGPHSTFFGLLNGFGIVVGGLFIAVFFYVMIKANRLLKLGLPSKRKDLGTTLFTSLWIAYSLTVFLHEMVYFTGHQMMISLLVMSLFHKMIDISVEEDALENKEME